MSKQPVSADGGAMPPAEGRSLVSIQDDLADVRSLIAAADMAASDLDPEQSDPMHALLTTISEKLGAASDALQEYREAANG
jgi:hypothetical protein